MNAVLKHVEESTTQQSTPNKKTRDYTHRYITRLHFQRTGKGWRVRIPKVGDWSTILVQQSFFDHEFGSKQRAFEAAKMFRDAVLRRLGRSDRIIRYRFPKKTKVYPIKVGVQLATWVRNGVRYWCIKALWCENGRARTRSRSVRKYGLLAAYQMAAQARDENTLGTYKPLHHYQLDKKQVKKLWDFINEDH